MSQAKSEGYKRSRNTRVFAVAVSADESGEDALDWLMAELVEDGDEVVAIRVIELDEGGRSSFSSVLRARRAELKVPGNVRKDGSSGARRV